MKKLLLVSFVVALVGVVAAEVVAPRIVESRIEHKASEEVQGVAAVDANVDSFPFVTRLLVTGTVNRLSVTLDEVARYTIPFASVRFDIDGVDLDRSALFEQTVHVRDVDSVTVTAEVTASALLDQLDAVENLTGIEITEGALRAAEAVIPYPPDLFPCQPTIQRSEERLVLSCIVDDVPPVLVRTLSAAAQR